MKKPLEMIQSHRYTRNADTSLYSDKIESSNIINRLSKGDWVGVLEKIDGWFRVLCIQGEGWVRSDDVEERSPFNLHVQWTPEGVIKYVAA
jgi:hypothetical protein